MGNISNQLADGLYAAEFPNVVQSAVRQDNFQLLLP